MSYLHSPHTARVRETQVQDDRLTKSRSGSQTHIRPLSVQTGDREHRHRGSHARSPHVPTHGHTCRDLEETQTPTVSETEVSAGVPLTDSRERSTGHRKDGDQYRGSSSTEWLTVRLRGTPFRGHPGLVGGAVGPRELVPGRSGGCDAAPADCSVVETLYGRQGTPSDAFSAQEP